ncbi:late competence protein ComER [Aneurinibacillus tyrosinisolvens]|uniref:late competence protein ComER n=1 Tax=Aneurinibacillus tyrosinisolvens TaxID=1443435 RepID=UPI00063EF1B5|nr:late competence protein ComER [Aneurinibacillus tyrosinisolvens]
MHIGFIGTGSMGTILIEAFIESGALLPSQIIASNRTREKLSPLLAKYPGINTAANRDVALQADFLFLCVKPLDYRVVLDEIRDCLDDQKLLLSITSSVGVERLESFLTCKVARVIPSITNAALSGATLVTMGRRLQDEDAQALFTLLSAISTPIHIGEAETRISSDIVSCGPAFFSFLLQRFIDSAIQETSLSEGQATEMMTQMIIGMGRLLEDGRFSLPTLQQRVCVPGGVTGVGLRVIDAETKDVFTQTIQATQEKFASDLAEVKASFSK